MKILVASDYGGPWGGAQIAMLNEINGFRKYGHQVKLLSSDYNPGYSPLASDYIFRHHPLYTRNPSVYWRYAYNPTSKNALEKAIDDFRPDIVHIHLFTSQLSPSILFIKREIPIFATVHDCTAFCPAGNRYIRRKEKICRYNWGEVCLRMGCITVLRLPQLLAREALIRKRRDRVTWIAPSDFMRRELLQAGYGKVVREPYGFDIESYPYYPPESRKGASAVLFLSRLDYSKGTHVLVRAFQTAAADVPGLKLFIGGEGSQMGPLRRLVYNLKLEDKVSLLGWIGQDRIKELHLRAGLVCAPFLGPDNQPLLVCEAMIMGTPLAATKVGGVPELVEHGVSGLLTEPGDANMLARAMLTLLEDVRLADRFAKKGRKKAEEMLHMEKHISMLTKIYTKRF